MKRAFAVSIPFSLLILLAKPAWMQFQYRRQQYFIEAAGRGDTESMKFWLSLGAEFNTACCGRYNAIVSAAGLSTPATVKFILENGGDVNAPAKFGLTALHVAVGRGDFSMVKFLVSRGADVNAVEGLTEETPLDRASQLTKPEIYEYLLAHGAKSEHNR